MEQDNQTDVRVIKLATFPYTSKTLLPDGWKIIDCRIMENPWANPKLRRLKGYSKEIINFVVKSKNFLKLFADVIVIINNTENTKIAFGCQSGKHKSMAMLEVIKNYLEEQEIIVIAKKFK